MQSLTRNPILLLVVVLCAALLLPALFMDGMFIDGLLYASVSKNYGAGNGSFWYMVFSETHYNAFHEQPPLMFVLQGMFFRVFGNSLYTERIYCLVAAIINALLIMRAWKIITGDSKTSWLPLLFWFVMPVTFWAFTNNVEECTMSVFVMLAMNAILRVVFMKYDEENSLREKSFWWIIAGFWILAAGLTKGVQGMFLLSAPFWCWAILKNGSFGKMLKRSGLIALIPVAFVALAWLIPTIRESFKAYFLSRYVKTFNNVTANSDNHFHLLFELLLDTLPIMFLVAVFILAGRKTPEWISKLRSNSRTIFFLLACGFSGILPLLVTREQRGFYLVTALPMLALGVALTVLPMAQRLTAFLNSHRIWKPTLNLFSALGIVVIAAITVMNAGQPKRDADKIAALQEIASFTGKNVIVTGDDNVNSDWSFLTYAQRFHGLSLTTYGNEPNAIWQLHPKGEPPQPGYALIPLKTTLFDLHKRNSK